jgi:hypothetical protein
MRDGKSNLQIVHLGTLTLSGTTAAASAWVDTRGFDECTILLSTNTVTDAGTASGFTATGQHSDLTTAASAASIVAADTTDGTITVTVTADGDDNKDIGAVGYVGSKRYVRFNVVGTTGTDAAVVVRAILSNAARAPTTLIGTSVAAT